MYKVFVYDPSSSFFLLWKLVSAGYDQKYLERVRVVLKGEEDVFWEAMDRGALEKRFGGTAQDLGGGTGYWPPVSLEEEVLELGEIKVRGIMTFDFLGHQSDTRFFKKYEPWEGVGEDREGWCKEEGKLDK